VPLVTASTRSIEGKRYRADVGRLGVLDIWVSQPVVRPVQVRIEPERDPLSSASRLVSSLTEAPAIVDLLREAGLDEEAEVLEDRFELGKVCVIYGLAAGRADEHAVEHWAALLGHALARARLALDEFAGVPLRDRGSDGDALPMVAGTQGWPKACGAC
jgi:hypothetical protein